MGGRPATIISRRDDEVRCILWAELRTVVNGEARDHGDVGFAEDGIPPMSTRSGSRGRHTLKLPVSVESEVTS